MSKESRKVLSIACIAPLGGALVAGPAWVVLAGSFMPLFGRGDAHGVGDWLLTALLVCGVGYIPMALACACLGLVMLAVRRSVHFSRVELLAVLIVLAMIPLALVAGFVGLAGLTDRMLLFYVPLALGNAVLAWTLWTVGPLCHEDALTIQT